MIYAGLGCVVAQQSLLKWKPIFCEWQGCQMSRTLHTIQENADSAKKIKIVRMFSPELEYIIIQLWSN